MHILLRRNFNSKKLPKPMWILQIFLLYSQILNMLSEKWVPVYWTFKTWICIAEAHSPPMIYRSKSTTDHTGWTKLICIVSWGKGVEDPRCKIAILLRNALPGGWREGSVVRSTCCSLQQTQVQFPEPTCWLTVIHSSSCKESDTLFCPL